MPKKQTSPELSLLATKWMWGVIEYCGSEAAGIAAL